MWIGTYARFRSHKMSKTPTYISYHNMFKRCENPKHKGYKNYGGRGIKVCPQKSFENFFDDIGEKPRGKSLGRINNDKNYTPSNTRWESSIQQANNRRNNIQITIDIHTYSISKWSKLIGINYNTIFKRFKRGWNPVDIVFKSVQIKRKNGIKHSSSEPI